MLIKMKNQNILNATKYRINLNLSPNLEKRLATPRSPILLNVHKEDKEEILMKKKTLMQIKMFSPKAIVNHNPLTCG